MGDAEVIPDPFEVGGVVLHADALVISNHLEVVAVERVKFSQKCFAVWNENALLLQICQFLKNIFHKTKFHF